MKIAVFHNLPSGGALRMLYAKIKCMQASGHRISIYSFSTAEKQFLPKPDLLDRCFDEPLDFKGFGRFRRYFTATRKLAEQMNHSDADIVWVEKCRYMGSPPIMRFLKKPYLFYSPEPLRIKTYENAPLSASDWCKFFLKIPKIYGHLIVKREDSKAMRHAKSVVLTNSEFTRRWLLDVYGVNAVVLYQGVDTDFFTPNAGRDCSQRYVLSVGRISEVKGHHFILNSLAKIPLALRPTLTIVCDDYEPAYRSFLEKRARIKNVTLRIYHRIDDMALRKLYQDCQFVLCAAKNEPFGLVPLEAMSCGAPVLAVKEGGFQETIQDQETGYLLNRDEKLWASQLQTLLEKRPQEINRICQTARSYATKRWSLSAFRQRLDEIFISKV